MSYITYHEQKSILERYKSIYEKAIGQGPDETAKIIFLQSCLLPNDVAVTEYSKEVSLSTLKKLSNYMMVLESFEALDAMSDHIIKAPCDYYLMLNRYGSDVHKRYEHLYKIRGGDMMNDLGLIRIGEVRDYVVRREADFHLYCIPEFLLIV